MAGAPQTYKKGTQDLSMHQDMYGWFWFLTKAGIIGVVLILVFMAYLFT